MKKFLLYSLLTGIFSTAFLPFLAAKSMVYGFISIKAFSLQILIQILFCLWLTLIVKYHEFRPRFSWMLASLCLFVFLSAVSNLVGIAPSQSMLGDTHRIEGWIQLVHILVFFIIIISVMQSQKLWHWFFRCWIFAFWGYFAWKFLHFLFGALAGRLPFSFMEFRLSMYMGDDRIDGPLGNSMFFSIYLLFRVFLSCILMHESIKNRKEKPGWRNHSYLLYIADIGLNLFLIYHAVTKSVFLGLFLSSLIILFFMIWKSKNRAIKVSAISLSILLFIACIGLYQLKDTEIIKNHPALGRFYSLSSQGTLWVRIYNYRAAWEGFKERPILGWGQEGFTYAFDKYYPSAMSYYGEWSDRVHNAFLEMLLTRGILGTISYLSLWVIMLYILWKVRKDIWNNVFILCVIISYACYLLFSFPTIADELLFFIIAAYLLRKSKDFHEEVPILSESKPSISPAIVLLVTFIPLCLSLFHWYIPQIQSYVLNKTAFQEVHPLFKFSTYQESLKIAKTNKLTFRRNLLIYVMDLIDSPMPPGFTKAVVKFCEQEWQKEIQENPYNARSYDFLAMFYKAIKNYDKAFEARLKSHELSPGRQIFLLDLAMHYMFLKKDPAHSLELAQKAYDAMPIFDEARRYYARLLISSAHIQHIPEHIHKAMDILGKNVHIHPDTKKPVEVRDLRMEKDVIITLLTTDNSETAIQALETKYKESPDFALARQLCWWYLKKEEREKAIALRDAFLSQFPAYQESQKEFIECYDEHVKNWK